MQAACVGAILVISITRETLVYLPAMMMVSWLPVLNLGSGLKMYMGTNPGALIDEYNSKSF